MLLLSPYAGPNTLSHSIFCAHTLHQLALFAPTHSGVTLPRLSNYRLDCYL